MNIPLLKNQCQRLCCLSTLFSVLTLPISAQAVPLTIRFDGEITAANNPLKSNLRPGDQVTIFYTFDSQAEQTFSGAEGYFRYDNSISAVSINTGMYSMTGTAGDILQDYQDELSNSVDFSSPFFALPSGRFVPVSAQLTWFSGGTSSGLTNVDPGGPSEHPRFDPDLPATQRYPNSDLYDADGNPVYILGQILGDLNQQLYFSNGTAVPKNGSFSLSFRNANGRVIEAGGRLLSGARQPVGAVAHWPLNEGLGETAHDLSGYHHSGALTRGPVWLDTELHFDGVDDYVDAGFLSVSGEALTLSAWAKSDDLANCPYNDCRIISKSTGTKEQQHDWMLSTVKVGDSTRLRFRLKTDSGTSTLIASSGNLTEGEWFHAAATYDGTTMRLFKNGEEVGSLTKTGNINVSDPWNDSVDVWIGGNPPKANARPWKGSIADVRVYQTALTQKEILSVIGD